MNTENDFYLMGFLDRKYSDLNPLNFGYHRCPAHHTGYGMRKYYLIHYVISGCGVLKRGGRVYEIKSGQIFIIQPDEDVSYTADAEHPWVYRWIGFNGSLAGRLDDLKSPVTDISSAAFSMLAALKDRQDTREEMGAAILHMIFAELFSDRSTHPHYVRRTVDTINSLYMSRLSVESLADNIGLDRRYLSRIFKKSIGMSIREYILKVRMDEAKRLLKEGKSVSLTAELVGYTDTFNFSKMFKKLNGVSPRRYAKQNS